MILTYAPYSISLQAATRRQIKRDYEQLGVTEGRAGGAVHISGGAYIFAAAEQEILEQLNVEVYHEFRESPQFKSLVDSGAVQQRQQQEEHELHLWRRQQQQQQQQQERQLQSPTPGANAANNSVKQVI